MNLESISRAIGFLLLLNSSVTLYYSPLVPMAVKNILFIIMVGIVTYFAIIIFMRTGADSKQNQRHYSNGFGKTPDFSINQVQRFISEFLSSKKKKYFFN